jgi:hypothetical protein
MIVDDHQHMLQAAGVIIPYAVMLHFIVMLSVVAPWKEFTYDRSKVRCSTQPFLQLFGLQL